MNCPNCRAELPENKKFCGACGAPVPSSNQAEGSNCPSCGFRVAAGKKFCGRCGASVSGAVSSVPAPTQPLPSVPRTPVPAPVVQPVRLVFTESIPASPPSALPSAAFPLTSNNRMKAPSLRIIVPILAALILVLVAVGWLVRGATLQIASDPPGSEVFVDNRHVGRTDSSNGTLTLPRISRGKHSIHVQHYGFEDWSDEFNLGWFESTHPVSANLPLPSFPLTVVTRPAGARIQVDGQDAGTSNANGVLVVPKLQKGQHQLVVRLADFPTLSSNFQVNGPAQFMADLAAEAARVQGEVQNRLQRADSLFQSRQYDAAIAECDSALQLAPGDTQAIALKARIADTKAILGVQ